MSLFRVPGPRPNTYKYVDFDQALGTFVSQPSPAQQQAALIATTPFENGVVRALQSLGLSTSAAAERSKVLWAVSLENF